MNLHGLKAYSLTSEEVLDKLLQDGYILLYQEIKNIPNQVNKLRLHVQDKCSNLIKSNPAKEVVNYALRYEFVEKDITGTYRFASRYGLSLKKNLTCSYGVNQILYLKEPFAKDINDKIVYKFGAKEEPIKYTHQRFMKQDEARYFIQVKQITIDKIENFYLDNMNFEISKQKNSMYDFLPLIDNGDNKEKDLKQKLFSNKHVVIYKCKLIDNPFENGFMQSEKKKFFYRLQLPNPDNKFDDSYISWSDYQIGYIDAVSKKDAIEQLEDEFKTTLPSKVIDSNKIGSKYTYILKVYPSDEYWDKYWLDDRECDICGTQFSLIDKINNFNNKGRDNCCCEECEEIFVFNMSKVNNTEYLLKKMEDNEGIHNPCIYKISNLITGMVYIGKTTQTPTYRWYQHFNNPSDNKFHAAISEHSITDWTFEVLESFTKENIEEIGIGNLDKYVSEREQHWIDEFDSINKGYNSVHANKVSAELKKIYNQGLFDEKDFE